MANQSAPAPPLFSEHRGAIFALNAKALIQRPSQQLIAAHDKLAAVKTRAARTIPPWGPEAARVDGPTCHSEVVLTSGVPSKARTNVIVDLSAVSCRA